MDYMRPHLSIRPGDVVQITGCNGLEHFLLDNVLCVVVDEDPEDNSYVLRPLTPGPHNWFEGDDSTVQNWVSREDFRVVVSTHTDWRRLADVEAFLSNPSTPPNGGTSA